jgi:hypothetical protein
MGICLGYMTAVVDYDSVLAARLQKKQDFCLPKAVEMEHVANVVLDYLANQDSEALSNLSASGLIVLALSQVYPCPK